MKTMKFDYLVVGAGLFGAVFAYEAARRGKKVKVIEKRSHIAGNIYTKEMADIQVHEYGAHIFHTDNPAIWAYIGQFAEFNSFINAPIADYHGEIYNLPFNMNTFNKLWGVTKPDEAHQIINQQRQVLNGQAPRNLEEQAISLVGTDIYQKLIKGYTQKQWGRAPKDLPAAIIKRLPVRFTYDNNYFSDRYQGIPIGGYTPIIEKMLSSENIEVETQVDFLKDKERYLNEYPKIIYTGMIDQFFDYELGVLAYRSLEFETELLKNVKNYQGNAVVNYTAGGVPYTRIIEHKHFDFGQQKDTIVTKEYPRDWDVTKEAYYPINDEINNQLYQAYAEKAKAIEQVFFGGRLGTYRYFDMHQVIQSALDLVGTEFVG